MKKPMKEMKKHSHGKFLLSVSMTIFGTLSLFTRNIPLGSGELALCRAVLAVVLILVYLAVSGQRIIFNKIKKELPALPWASTGFFCSRLTDILPFPPPP